MGEKLEKCMSMEKISRMSKKEMALVGYRKVNIVGFFLVLAFLGNSPKVVEVGGGMSFEL
jgi:hypothetical protein